MTTEIVTLDNSPKFIIEFFRELNRMLLEHYRQLRPKVALILRNL